MVFPEICIVNQQHEVNPKTMKLYLQIFEYQSRPPPGESFYIGLKKLKLWIQRNKKLKT